MSVDFRRMLDAHDPEGKGVAPPVTTSKMVIPIVLASSSRHVIYTDGAERHDDVPRKDGWDRVQSAH